jgi:hypothetical protein
MIINFQIFGLRNGIIEDEWIYWVVIIVEIDLFWLKIIAIWLFYVRIKNSFDLGESQKIAQKDTSKENGWQNV